MTRLERLYDRARKNGVNVEYFPLPLCASVSTKYKNTYYIGIDKSRFSNTGEETVIFAHELGHCVTDSFYSEYDSRVSRVRCEKKADEWAIREIVPFSDFHKAYKNGCREIWEFADELGITPAFAEKAMIYYKDKLR